MTELCLNINQWWVKTPVNDVHILLSTALFLGLVLYDTVGMAQNFGQSKRLVCPFKEHLRRWSGWNVRPNHTMVTIPRCSIYGIFTYIYHRIKPNVGKYFIGESGIWLATWELALSTVVITSSWDGSCWFGIWAIPNHQTKPSSNLSLTPVHSEAQKPDRRSLAICLFFLGKKRSI